MGITTIVDVKIEWYYMRDDGISFRNPPFNCFLCLKCHFVCATDVVQRPISGADVCWSIDGGIFNKITPSFMGFFW